jgi:translation initiation factor IF-1
MEVLPRSVFRVEMPNGHRILGHLSGQLRRGSVRIDAGDAVRVQMTPFDFSKGCIIAKTVN